MKITACSIVKNEEKNITRSIESYRRVVDEIIIVDTGSTDNTVRICEKLGAKVFHYEWHNDFAAAKNFALDQATGDWIIFLDADEWFVPTLVDNNLSNVIKQAEVASDSRVELLRLTLCNVEQKTGQITSKTSVGRIFKHKESIRYVGSIHEDIKNNGQPVVSAKVDELEIYHSGYSQEIIKDKSKRNLEMLYDKYRKGEGDAGIYFYLCRENSILGKNEEAIKFYELFLKSDNVDEIIRCANVYVSIYEFGIKLKMAQPNKYTNKEIKAEIDRAIEKYPQLPMHYYLMGCYYFRFDYDKALGYFEKAVDMNKNYKGEYINNLVTAIIDAYLKMACIYKSRQEYIKALDITVEGIKVEPLEKNLFEMLISLIKTQTPVDIILFLSRYYDLSNEEHVTFLTKQLMWTKCHEVFLFFAKRYNQEFLKEDETTYIAMLLTDQAKEVTRIGMQAYFNGGKDDDRYFATLAMMLSEDQEAFEANKVNLNRPYATIAQRFIQQTQISSPTIEEIKAWQHLYSHIYYLATPEQLERYENIFEEVPLEIVPVIVHTMLSDENYKKIKITGPKLMERIKNADVQNELKKILAYEMYFSHEYEQAVEAFEAIYLDKYMEYDLYSIQYLKGIAKLAGSISLRKKAERLADEQVKGYLQERDIIEATTTKKIEELPYQYLEIDKSKMSLQEFMTLVEESCSLKPKAVKCAFELMEEYINKDMDERAFEMLILLIKNDLKKEIAYFRLGELFNRLQNSEMALYCHEQVFVENPLFAQTLLGEKALDDDGYRFHHIETEDRMICPICGGESKRAGVYNTLLSEDYSVDYPAIKIWRRCNACSHLFTESVPVNILDRNDGANSKQISCKMIDSNSSIEFVHHYRSQGTILEMNADDISFMLLAEEYGYNVKGLMEDGNKANKIQREYGLDIEHALLNTYDNEEQFDIISMTNVLERSNNPTEIIKKAMSMLTEEGVLYIKVPNYMSAASRSLRDKGLEYRKVKMIQYFSRRSMTVLLEENGLEMIAYQKAHSPSGSMEIIAKRK